MKVVHIITSLEDGGAEAALYRLCIHDHTAEHVVISLKDWGKYGDLLHNSDIEVHCLNMSAGRLSFLSLFKLHKKLRQLRPDIVQTWMYHANLIGGMIAFLAGIKNIYWGIHNTMLDKHFSKRATIWINKLCALLSYWIPKKIVCCAQSAVKVHSIMGYKSSKMITVVNGYEIQKFRYDSKSAAMLASELSLPSGLPILGMVARFDPQKDHFGLLKALQHVKRKTDNFKFLLIGRGLHNQNFSLTQEINKLGLQDNFLLLGQRQDIPSIMSLIDIHILSSRSEAFPNVLAEAMACETPCITTDVGDAALIVSDTGWVVPSQNSQALANSILTALAEKEHNQEAWHQRKQRCRQRIIESFSIKSMIENYHTVWNRK